MNEYSSKSMTPSCTLCHNDFDLYYRMPRVVPKCGHTYCEKCISNKLTIRSNRKVFVCPECSSQVVIRKGVIQDVPKNIGIIDILKNLKKFVNNDKKQQKKKQLASMCMEHHKPFELHCQTCKFINICSHCALFGQHKNHNFCKETPATQIDLKEVKEFYELLCDTFKITLLPSSQHNIKKSMKRLITQSLHKSIKKSFKQYYDIIQKKEFQLLQECNNIIITQGGIDNNIQKLIKEYDNLKDKYQLQWKPSIQNESHGKNAGSIGISSIEDYITKCEVFLDNIKSIEKYATQHVGKLNQQISLRMMQTTLFKIQEMPFSLKQTIQQLHAKEEIPSPQRRVRMKSATSDIKSKSVINRQQVKPFQVQQKKGNKSQVRSTIVKSPKKDTALQLSDNFEDFNLLELQKSQIANYKQPSKNLKELKELISYKNIQPRQTLPPKLPKSKNSLNDFDSKTISIKSNKDDDKSKYYHKEISPAKTISVVNKKVNNLSNVSFSNVPPPALTIEDFKFVRPTKEISFHFLSKYQEITVQTDRQSQGGTLELVNLDINDTLLTYALDYLRIKKYQFQVIKLVKNMITDEGLKTLLSFLINDNSTQLLNLTSNQLTAKSLEIILLFATKNHFLKTFNLSNNKLSSAQVKAKRTQFEKYELQIAT